MKTAKLCLFILMVSLLGGTACIKEKSEDQTKEPAKLKEAERQDSTRFDATNPDSLYPEREPEERDSTGPGLYRSKGE
ncbi:MAG: hypothetical protein P1R58_09755 [bacterium]|nr:hypothetical protein [bacterium]